MNTISTVSLTNGSAATASTSTILAIDLGKYKSVACLHDPDSGEFRFTTFDTSRAELGTNQLSPCAKPARRSHRLGPSIRTEHDGLLFGVSMAAAAPRNFAVRRRSLFQPS